MLRQLLEVVLLLAQGLYKALLEAPDFKSLELAVERLAQEATRRLLVMALEAKDRWLMERRDRRLRVVDLRPKSLLTKVGEMTITRRYYVDRATGEGHFLLDEALGLWPRQRYSPAVRELAIELAVETSFGTAARWLGRWTQGQVRISRMAIWTDVQEAGSAAAEEVERVREALFERGEVPEGARVARELNVEFDELFVRGRRRVGGRKEWIGLKHALAYEGKETDARGRAVLKQRRVHVTVGEGTDAVEQALADFGRQWDFSRVERCTVGGDGAAWIRRALEYIPHATYRLDPFHLRRALREGLGHDGRVYPRVCEALAAGKPWREVQQLLHRAARRTCGERGQRARELMQYLERQWDGIAADPEARRLGAIEAENSHVLAKRMKRRGAAWSAKGAHHMGRLRAAQANGELERYASAAWVRRRELLATLPRPGILRESPTAKDLEDAAVWLRARVPALYGPHSDRHWVEVLRQLTNLRSPAG